MLIRDLNWMQLEAYLERDDRVVLPLGSTEQHGYLSLLTDAILPERLAAEAAEPLGVPVYPAQPFGVSPYFLGYPGTISLRVGTYVRLIGDILDSLARHGFRRILIVNGHGGNRPAAARAEEWMTDRPEVRVKVHHWWNAPRTWAKVTEIDPVASHASWMENYPWTRLDGVELPDGAKEPIDPARKSVLDPDGVRDYLGDGVFGGRYQRSDEEMLAIWDVAVRETRAALEGPWS